MIGKLLQGSEWSRATEYLSPVFFQVVPTLAMGRKIAKLISSYSDSSGFAKICLERAAAIKPLGITIDFEKNSEATLSEDDGFKILVLYFYQLLVTDTPLLDLRYSAFSLNSENQLIWTPKPLYTTLDASFAQSIRGMYLGFYGDNFEQFDLALKELDLLHARELFLNHFGQSQSAMKFDLVTFRKTFHDLFVSCKVARTRLHPDFLAFGAGLFCLYENLARNERTFDVRAAFNQALELTRGVG